VLREPLRELGVADDVYGKELGGLLLSDDASEEMSANWLHAASE
jgi:hypothetical protein